MKKLFLIIFLLVSPSAFATNFCSDGSMKAAWQMNEASGTSIADCTSNSNTGTLSGATSGVNGKYSFGISFPLVDNNKMTVTLASSINNISSKTIGGWLSVNTLGADSGFGGKGMIMQKGYGWQVKLAAPAKICFNANRDSQEGRWCTDDNSFPADGVFRHFAIVYDNSSTSNNPTIYINDVSVNVTQVQVPIGSNVDDSPYNITVGLDYVDLGEFDGIMDEMFIYSGALTITQIGNIMNSGLDGGQSAPATPVVNTYINSNSVINNAVIN